MGKTLGIVFIAIGVGILFLAGAWSLSNTGLEGSAKVLVLGFGFFIALEPSFWFRPMPRPAP